MDRFFKFILYSKVSFLLVVVLSLSACGSLDKLGEDYYEVSPNPLEVHGGKVKVSISADFPKEVFPKDAAIEATPVLVYDGGEKPYESVTYQGDEYPDNFEVISSDVGGTAEYEGEIEYSNELKSSNLELRLVAKQGQTEKPFAAIPLAKGVITTSLLAESDETPLLAENQFKRITEEQVEAKINFDYNSSKIKNRELRDDDYKALLVFLKQLVSSEDLELIGVNLMGYASPEGEVSLNENLSLSRANAVAKLLKKELKRIRYKGDVSEDQFQVKALGADWDGLLSLLDKDRNMAMDDKDAIKRSLDQTPMLDDKEKTLKSLATTYDVLSNDILPALRRTKFIFNYKKVGRDDEEILSIASSDDVSTLSVDEVLHIAEVSSDKKVSVDVLTKYAPIFSQDYRVLTNLGYYLFLDEKYDLAAKNFSAAYAVEQNDVTNANMSIVNKKDGKIKEAVALVKPVDVDQAKYNYGVILLEQGKYTQAVKYMSSVEPTFNLGLAKLLRGDYSGALKALQDAKIQTAKADYLRAIASMRMGNVEDAKAFIDAASKKELSYATMAEKDLEFKDIYNPEPATTPAK